MPAGQTPGDLSYRIFKVFHLDAPCASVEHRLRFPLLADHAAYQGLEWRDLSDSPGRFLSPGMWSPKEGSDLSSGLRAVSAHLFLISTDHCIPRDVRGTVSRQGFRLCYSFDSRVCPAYVLWILRAIFSSVCPWRAIYWVFLFFTAKMMLTGLISFIRATFLFSVSTEKRSSDGLFYLYYLALW